VVESLAALVLQLVEFLLFLEQSHFEVSGLVELAKALAYLLKVLRRYFGRKKVVNLLVLAGLLSVCECLFGFAAFRAH